jgi:hypothetical protein
MKHHSTEPGHEPVAAENGLEAGSTPAAATRQGIDRRTLLRGGASAAPVLLTLYSGPVSATQSCTVASSFVSAATFASRSPGTTYIKCTSKNAGHWRTAAQSGCAGSTPTVPPYTAYNVQWPAWASVKVKDHLATTGSSYDEDYVGYTMKRGTALAASGELAILQHILGLTLTLQYDSNYITTAGAPGGELSKAYLVSVWQRYKSTGAYVMPAANVNWDATGLLSWLKMLQYDIPIA